MKKHITETTTTYVLEGDAVWWIAGFLICCAIFPMIWPLFF